MVNLQDTKKYLCGNTLWPFSWIIAPLDVSWMCYSFHYSISNLKSEGGWLKWRGKMESKNKLFDLELQTVLWWGQVKGRLLSWWTVIIEKNSPVHPSSSFSLFHFYLCLAIARTYNELNWNQPDTHMSLSWSAPFDVPLLLHARPETSAGPCV